MESTERSGSIDQLVQLEPDEAARRLRLVAQSHSYQGLALFDRGFQLHGERFVLPFWIRKGRGSLRVVLEGSLAREGAGTRLTARFRPPVSRALATIFATALAAYELVMLVIGMDLQTKVLGTGVVAFLALLIFSAVGERRRGQEPLLRLLDEVLDSNVQVSAPAPAWAGTTLVPGALVVFFLFVSTVMTAVVVLEPRLSIAASCFLLVGFAWPPTAMVALRWFRQRRGL